MILSILSSKWTATFRTHYIYEHKQCSETLAFKLQTPVNHPEESIRHSEHGERLKPKTIPTLPQYQEDACKHVVHGNESNRKTVHKTQRDRVFFPEITTGKSCLGLLAQLRKATISFMSVRPHGTTRFSRDGFSWNFIFDDFSKACR
jgi:hypothetical protein